MAWATHGARCSRIRFRRWPSTQAKHFVWQVVVVGVGDTWRAVQAEAALRRIGLLSPDGFGTCMCHVRTYMCHFRIGILSPDGFGTRQPNMARIRQSRPNYGLRFLMKVLKTFHFSPSLLGSCNPATLNLDSESRGDRKRQRGVRRTGNNRKQPETRNLKPETRGQGRSQAATWSSSTRPRRRSPSRASSAASLRYASYLLLLQDSAKANLHV